LNLGHRSAQKIGKLDILGLQIRDPEGYGKLVLDARAQDQSPLHWLGFLSLWGTGAQPTVSTLNASDGTIVANAALVPPSNAGSVSVFAGHLTHLILDINAYFAQ
jgi:hypothetical protein